MKSPPDRLDNVHGILRELCFGAYREGRIRRLDVCFDNITGHADDDLRGVNCWRGGLTKD